MNFASYKWFFCLKDDIIMRKLNIDILLLKKFRELVLKRKKLCYDHI